jgi:kynurenine formamidase
VSGRWRLDVDWPAPGRYTFYDLSFPIRTGMPHANGLPGTEFHLVKKHGDQVLDAGLSTAAEALSLGGHTGSHVDGWAHVSRDGLIFGGHDIRSAQSVGEGMLVAGVDELPPMLGQGHLVDLPLLLGREANPDDGVGAPELERWFAGRGKPSPGSVVLLRTGWGAYWEDAERYLAAGTGFPGLVLDGARWLGGRGISVWGVDTLAGEKQPDRSLPVHVHLLVERGIPILEMLNLELLARDGVRDFFFLAAALPISGGTGSPLRPLAAVADPIAS